MTYNHKTDHSHTPDLDFWRSMENLLNAFPYKQEKTGYIPSNEFITNFYERRYEEKFDVDNNDVDIYGKPITGKYIWNISGNQRLYLDEMDEDQRNRIEVRRINKEINSMGKIIKFLSNNISEPDKVNKFQHILESTYYFLEEITKLNPELGVIGSAGLGDKSSPNYERKKSEFLSKNGGIMTLKEYTDKFNDICRIHRVPFIMLTFYDACYVVHITDIFIQKAIQDLPIFLSQPDLQHANELFVEAFNQRNAGNYKECLAKIREGLEAIRDYIYNKFSLTKGTNLHNDMKNLFNSFSSTVFDYTKIPEQNPSKLNKIVDYLRDSVLLALKFGNFGHHTISNPNLIENNTSYFTLGLIASILPYLNYILK
jgi:hypothetical protein